MNLAEIIANELDESFPGLCVGFAWSSKIANGNEDPPKGWEKGDLLGCRIDFRSGISPEDKKLVRARVLQIVQNKADYSLKHEQKRKLLITADKMPQLITLLISKGVFTQEELEQALLGSPKP